MTIEKRNELRFLPVEIMVYGQSSGLNTKIIMNRSQRAICLRGVLSGRSATRITELYLDDSELIILVPYGDTPEEFSDSGESVYMFDRHANLACLSIKNATCRLRNEEDSRETAQPVPQEMLIKMVRRHPSLRWLRSDLSEENIAMLQQERPEITFFERISVEFIV